MKLSPANTGSARKTLAVRNFIAFLLYQGVWKVKVVELTGNATLDELIAVCIIYETCQA